MTPELQPYILPSAAIAVALVVFLLAPLIFAGSKAERASSIQVLILRSMLGLFVLLQIADIAFNTYLQPYYHTLFLQLALTTFAFAVFFVVFNAMSRVLQTKFGNQKHIDGQTVSVPSYHSRLAGLILLALLSVVLIYSLIEIWRLESLIEKTGFVGIIAAFLVLTSAVWLPDLFNGIVLLGSSMAEEGDTVEMSRDGRVCIIHRLSLFYTLLLDIDSNNRVLVKNSELVRHGIDNQTKRASTDGLRRTINFKLGYPIAEETQKGKTPLFNCIEHAVASSFQRASTETELKINTKIEFQWYLVDAGDYALEFSLVYFLEPLPETKSTATARKYLRSTPNALTMIFYQEATSAGLSLATPALSKIDAVMQSINRSKPPQRGPAKKSPEQPD